ncbi:fasciclin-1-like [Diorhabda sublineata]|uniref:fasciclin-1-like n=1 Tax=Diorhabda sublineata TaxID=1163346 RepID=UPI0024E0FBD0|nr:fasciclin-1-like [Diorhabda sublineata]
MFHFLLVLLIFSENVDSQRYRTIYQKIQQEREYAEFKTLIKNNTVALLNLHYDQLTVFVPLNASFKHSKVKYSPNVAFYHMSFEVITLEMLYKINSIPTVILENPPLWITRFAGDIYVNNAKIIQDKSDYSARSRAGDMGKQQVLHVIDSVLDPIITETPTTSPTAYDFLNSISNWNLGTDITVSNFLTKIQETKVQYVFKQNSGYTFFVPIDSGIGPYKFKMINKHIIFGHVIPFQVLFTRPTPRKFAYESLANDETVYIVLSFEQIQKKLFVKGTMRGMLGDGDFYSEVLVPNIPVRNGVVHLISQPLGIYSRNLKPFPYLSVLEKITLDPNTNVFYEMGERTGFNDIFSRKNVTFTYFVPNDLAWKIAEDNYLEKLDTDIQILGRHLILSYSPFSIEQLLSLTKANNYTDIELNTPIGPLRIMVLLINGDYYLKWHNRFIKIIRTNYECSDGIVHVLASPLANFRRRDVNDFGNIIGRFLDKISVILKDNELE